MQQNRNRDRLSVIFSYLVAAACVSGALLLREILNRQFGMSLVAVTFYPSVLVAALIEGLLPGLFATVLSTLLLWYLLLAPNFPPLPMGQGDMVNLIVFAAVNAGMAVLGSNHRRLRLRARAEKQHLETVIGDLDHRLKHILSVAQGISRQVAERTDDVRQFQDVFQERLNSLTKSHKLLVDRKWSGVDITDLANAQLIPFNNAHQITTEGDTVFLNPTATQQIGLALYELASSSTKYGTLKKGGHISLSWRVFQDFSLQLVWQETGASHNPSVLAHVLLTTVVPKTLRGTASLAESADGLIWRLSIHSEYYAKSKPQELIPTASGRHPLANQDGARIEPERRAMTVQ